MADTPPLPRLLADLAEAQGIGAALTLAREAGGTVIYVPKRLTRTIERRFGRAIGHWLVEQYGPAMVEIPLGPNAREWQRAAAIRAAIVDQRGSANDMARLFGVTTRTVKRHRAKARDDDADLPLLAGLKRE